jgi:hypothetical protein
MSLPFNEAEALEAMSELARLSFPPDTPPNTFTVGTIAAAVKMAATSLVETGVLASTVLRESRENTMVLPQSINALAAYNQFPVTLARPAVIDVLLLIPLANAERRQSFRISTSDLARIGDYSLMVVRDVVVERASEIWRATYDMNTPDILGEPLDPNCQIFNSVVEGRAILGVIVKMVQARRRVTTFELLSADTSTRSSFEVEYNEQLAKTLVYYDPTSALQTTDIALQSAVKIATATSTIEAITLGAQASVYINYLTNNVNRLSFSPSENNFRPRIGSRLIVATYTTRGGDIGTTNADMRVALQCRDLNLTIGGRSVTPFTGGINRPSLRELKINAINNGMVRETIATDFDIAEALRRRVAGLKDGSGSQIQVRKTRDDVLRRTWGVSIVLRGPDGLVVPTATANIEASIDEIETRGWLLPINTPVLYDADTAKYRLAYDLEDVPVDVPNNYPLYVIPFAVAIRLKPFPIAVLMRTSVDDSYVLQYRAVNSAVNQVNMIATGVRIQRDAARDRRYTVTLRASYVQSAMTSSMYRAIFIVHDGVKAVGWREFDQWNTSLGVFVGSLSTNDRYNIEKRTFMLTNLRSLATGEITPNVEVGENLWLEVVLLTERQNSQGDFNFAVSSTSQLYIRQLGNAGAWNNMVGNSDLQNYVPVTVYTTKLTSEFPTPVGNVNLWRTLTDSTNYDVAINKSGLVTIYNLPMVHGSYLVSQPRVSAFNKSMGDLLGVMSQIRGLLHNNTNIELQFVNTHGVSLRTTANNLSIGIGIRIRTLREPSLSELRDIKRAVVEYIESVNATVPITTLAFSNLATRLETRFAFIRSIEMTHLANDVRQIIEGANVDREDLRPEYLCVARRPNSRDDDFNPDITIEIN